MPKEFVRADRVSSEIQKFLSVLISRELKDPAIGEVNISGVDVTRDMSYAKVYLILRDSDAAKETLAGMKRAASFLRMRLGQEMTMRSVPQLRFYHDDSLERGDRIEALLAKARPKNQ